MTFYKSSAASPTGLELPVKSERSQFRASDPITVLEPVCENALPLIDQPLVEFARTNKTRLNAAQTHSSYHLQSMSPLGKKATMLLTKVP